MHEAENGHDDEEGGGVEEAPHEGPGDLAYGKVVDGDRSGEDGFVALLVLQLEKHAERAVEDGAVHGRGGQQGRGHERRVAEGLTPELDVADELADPDAHGEQVEDGLEEPSDEHEPQVPVHHYLALEDPVGAGPREQERRSDPEGGVHQVTSL